MNEYLVEFGENFYTQIKRLIDEAILKQKTKENELKETFTKLGLVYVKGQRYTKTYKNEMLQGFKDLLAELGLQVQQYEESNRRYFGRNYLMEKIKNYIFSESSLPFIVTGESGSGKTNLMALLHYTIPSWFADPSKFILVKLDFVSNTKFKSMFI